MAKQVVETTLKAVMKGQIFGQLLSRKACHIAVIVPSMPDDRGTDYADWPDFAIKPHVLYQHSERDASPWTKPYDEIARCKALQLWHGRQDGGTDVLPHLLFPGDAPFWGGVKRDGIVVACSGVQSHFDRMISSMICDQLIALAYEAHEKYRAQKPAGEVWIPKK